MYRLRRATWLRPTAGYSLRRDRFVLSQKCTYTLQLCQGGKLTLDLSALRVSKVILSSKWQDHVEVACIDGFCDLTVSEEKVSNAVQVTAKDNGSNSAPLIEVLVPEYLDIDINAHEVDLSLLNKLQGDMSIKCDSGTIIADKLRGSWLDFDCGTADLTVRKLMEGSSNIQCRALKAKMINGDSINVSAEHVSVDVIYGEQTSISATDDITVGLLKGNIEAHSEKGNVSVSGIDGSFDVHAECGSIRLQINKLYNGSNDGGGDNGVPMGSQASAPEGHIVAIVDPELAATVQCESESAGFQRVCSTINSDAFELQAELVGEVRTPRTGTWEGGVIRGFLTGKSAGVKRPIFSSGASQSGKIDLSGAEAQSQQTAGSSQRSADTGAQPPSMPSSAMDVDLANTSHSNNQLIKEGGFDINLFARGNVRIDTMSWIQIIRSKYGFEDNVSTNAPAPGRTASANVNAAKVANSVLFEDKTAV